MSIQYRTIFISSTGLSLYSGSIIISMKLETEVGLILNADKNRVQLSFL